MGRASGKGMGMEGRIQRLRMKAQAPARRDFAREQSSP
jgi:hypothetical protein